MELAVATGEPLRMILLRMYSCKSSFFSVLLVFDKLTRVL